jgi:multiple sugar transport system permease protein
VSSAQGQAIFRDVPEPAPRRPNLGQKVWTARYDYLYVAPAILVMLIVIAYPIYYTIELSFFNTPASLALSDKTFNGLDNYVTILGSAVFWKVTWQTVVWTVLSTALSFLLGLGAALALHREFAGRALLRGLLLIPWVVSAVAASYVWKWLYHSDFGAISAFLTAIGLIKEPINFIDNASTSLYSLIVVNVWKEFSFAMIMLMAGLQTVPDSLLRAAQVDGASPWQRFWHVTFPHLQGVSTVTILLLVVQNFNSFIIPFIMTGGGPVGSTQIWITHIYELAFLRQRWGVGAAYAVLLFLIMMTLGYFYVRALTRGDDSRSGA